MFANVFKMMMLGSSLFLRFIFAVFCLNSVCVRKRPQPSLYPYAFAFPALCHLLDYFYDLHLVYGMEVHSLA